MTGRSKTKAAAFTLMEVLAAMVLLALVLPAVMKGISIATVLASDSVSKVVAAELAENRLNEAILLSEWKSGSGSGDFGSEYPDYRWMLTTSDGTQAGLKRIDMTVTWEKRADQYEFQLTTFIYESTE